MKKHIFVSLAALLACGCSLSLFGPARPYPSPILMPGTTPEMQSPGYWVSLSPGPDKPAMTREEITKFNTLVSDGLKARTDIFTASPFFSKWTLISNFENTLKTYQSANLFYASGKKVPSVFYYKVGGNINASEILYDGVNQYGFVVKTASLRALPIKQSMYRTRGDTEADALLKCTLDIGAPLIVQHETFDKKWYYVLTEYYSGWIEADNAVLCELQDVKDFLSKSPFCVVTSAKADVFLDEEMSGFYGTASMGTRLPTGTKSTEDAVNVVAPYRDKEGKMIFGDLFIRRNSIHQGYLPYTPRSIINEAFEYINQPYGSNGIYSFTDNQTFVAKVFSTTGVFLPVSYSSTTALGDAIAAFGEDIPRRQRFDSLTNSVPGGVTLLFTDDNAYIYLGAVKGAPYTIREIWTYKQFIKNTTSHDISLKRAVVTDLLLEDKTSAGALIDRLISARIVKN